MNVMLTRLPDGTVNAQPGDAVEVFIDGKWEAGFTFNDFHHGAIVMEHVDYDFPFSTPGYVRHARGGAGHLRLQVARLRAFIEKEFGAMERFEELTEGEYKRGVNAMAHINRIAGNNAIEDTENYEYAEPEA